MLRRIQLGKSTGENRHVNRFVSQLANRHVRTCKTRLDTTTKYSCCNITVQFCYFMIPWQHVSIWISTLPTQHTTFMFYHGMNIYHDSSNKTVQVCSFIKAWIVWSNIHKQVCQEHCSSWAAQTCSSLSTGKNKLCVFTCVLYRVNFLTCVFLYCIYLPKNAPPALLWQQR